MESIKSAIWQVRRQPTKVQVAVVVLLIFIVAIVTLVLTSLVVESGVLGALTFVGVVSTVGLLFWAVITLYSSDL